VKKIASIPCFIRLKKKYSSELSEKNMTDSIIYTATRKGWDLKSKPYGKEVYFIKETEKWVPSDNFDTIPAFSPN
jgi:hypothetical protein